MRSSYVTWPFLHVTYGKASLSFNTDRGDARLSRGGELTATLWPGVYLKGRIPQFKCVPDWSTAQGVASIRACAFPHRLTRNRVRGDR